MRGTVDRETLLDVGVRGARMGEIATAMGRLAIVVPDGPARLTRRHKARHRRDDLSTPYARRARRQTYHRGRLCVCRLGRYVYMLRDRAPRGPSACAAGCDVTVRMQLGMDAGATCARMTIGGYEYACDMECAHIRWGDGVSLPAYIRAWDDKGIGHDDIARGRQEARQTTGK